MKKVDISNFFIPTIDIPATSIKLKMLRETNSISVAQLQKLLSMENPQSIYTWENPEKKYLPRLDNLITLAKLYKVTLDELIVLKEDDASTLNLNEPKSLYGFAPSILDFINLNASKQTKLALERFYSVTL